MNALSTTRAAVLVGAIAFATVAGGAAQAQAAGLKSFSNLNNGMELSEVHKVGHRNRRFKRFRFRHRNQFHGCGYYKWKWHETGYFFWKKKFFICKGWL